MVDDIMKNTISIEETNSIKENKKLYEIYSISSEYYQKNLDAPCGKTAKNYLKDRKIDESTIKKFNIGLSFDNTEVYNILSKKGFSDDDLIDSGICYKKLNKIYDVFKNRIMFPLCDLDGNVVGFSGRICDNSNSSKYVNTKETKIFKKGNLLYNYHNAKIHAQRQKSIVVVEGIMDVIRLYSIGIENVVAIMGTSVTDYQVSLIQKLAPNIVLMFSGDSAGQMATNIFLEKYGNKLNNVKVVGLEELDLDKYILKYGKEKMIMLINSIENDN